MLVEIPSTLTAHENAVSMMVLELPSKTIMVFRESIYNYIKVEYDIELRRMKIC